MFQVGSKGWCPTMIQYNSKVKKLYQKNNDVYEILERDAIFEKDQRIILFKLFLVGISGLCAALIFKFLGF